MANSQDDIHPISSKMVSRHEREVRNGHPGIVIWLTGLSGSGKSTLGIGLERRLFEEGVQVVLLDGDNVRTGINNNLGFSEEDRQENIRRIAEVARLFLDAGLVVISSFISPTRAIRNQARDIIGAAHFVEVFVDAPLEICEQRDVKGLYKKARAGQTPDFTGIHSRYEIPEFPDIRIDTTAMSISEAVDILHTRIRERIQK